MSDLVPCPECHGAGSVECACHGRAARWVHRFTPVDFSYQHFAMVPRREACHTCYGSGTVCCDLCHGLGDVYADVPAPPPAMVSMDREAVKAMARACRDDPAVLCPRCRTAIKPANLVRHFDHHTGLHNR